MAKRKKAKKQVPVEETKPKKEYGTFKEAWCDRRNPDYAELHRLTMAEGTVRPTTKLTADDIARAKELLKKYGASRQTKPAPPGPAKEVDNI